MPDLNPIDDINTYLGVARRLSGKTYMPGQSPEINSAVLNSLPNGPGPEMLAQAQPIEAAMRARTEGASHNTQQNAAYLATGIPRNYEGMAEALARTHGPDVVNGIIKILPTLSPAQMNALAPLLGQAVSKSDQVDSLRASGGPR